MTFKKNFNFTVGDLGDALAFIVSQIEGEQYILEYVNYHAPSWMRGVGTTNSCKTLLSIVKSGYQNLYFVSNYRCPWMIDKVSHPITCVYDPCIYVNGDLGYFRRNDPYRGREGNFETEFKDNKNSNTIKVNPFPYLNEFVNELASLQAIKKLNKKEIFKLAQDFVAAKLQATEEKDGGEKSGGAPQKKIGAYPSTTTS